jgi:anti-sigma B factor antagonist
MELDVADMENGITRISISGRLDIEGALAIESEFNKIAEEKKKIVVDLSEVTFIASLGIRTLVSGAKTTVRKGGKMVLLNPQPNVEKVLTRTRVDTMMPIIHGLTAVPEVFGA